MSDQISCLIVDDEPIATQILERYVSRIPYVALIGVCNDAIEALDSIGNHVPDVVFLDINMPEMTGFEMLDALRKSRPNIVITTAYPDFALKGYEYDILDYLMKPISFDKFVKAIEKVKERKYLLTNTYGGKSADKGEIRYDSQSFFLRADKKNYRLNPSEIKYIEALEDYLKIYLNEEPNKFILARLTMKNILSNLPQEMFIRIHRSHIININQIKHTDGNQVILSSDETFQVGKTYQDEVRTRIKGLTL